jgi:hypothetical protein
MDVFPSNVYEQVSHLTFIFDSFEDGSHVDERRLVHGLYVLEYGDSPLVQIRAIQARPHRHGQEQGLDI